MVNTAGLTSTSRVGESCSWPSACSQSWVLACTTTGVPSWLRIVSTPVCAVPESSTRSGEIEKVPACACSGDSPKAAAAARMPRRWLRMPTSVDQ
jgi:hypothetical protein